MKSRIYLELDYSNKTLMFSNLDDSVSISEIQKVDILLPFNIKWGKLEITTNDRVLYFPFLLFLSVRRQELVQLFSTLQALNPNIVAGDLVKKFAFNKTSGLVTPTPISKFKNWWLYMFIVFCGAMILALFTSLLL